MQSSPIQYLAPVGRILLSLIFLASAAAKITDWQKPAGMMADRGLPAVNVLLSVAVALEIIGGVSVLLGLYARVGALLLLIFLIPVSVIMHNFWAFEEGPERMGQMINFMKNVSIMGGVTMILALGAGPCSIDSLLKPRPKRAPTPTPAS
jgi:putative oxidoreductase